jgi:hypothetical protein
MYSPWASSEKENVVLYWEDETEGPQDEQKEESRRDLC